MRFASSALVKAMVVAGVALLLLIPVQMLRNLVNERAALREQAIASVSRGWGGRQLLGGPILAIPATVTVADSQARELHKALRDWYVLPDSLELESTLTVQEERRKLGVYEVPVYLAKVRAVARFDVAAKVAALTAAQTGVTLQLERARLLLPVSDARGVRNVTMNGESLVAGAFEPHPGFPITAISAPLRSDADLRAGPSTFDVSLVVAGTTSLQFLPLARSTGLKLTGNWPDPGFARGFLPSDHQIDAGGFRASWDVLDLNRAYGSQWFQYEIDASALQDSAFGVDLVQPVDLYQRAERSVKYAGLFIALSLLTLFLWEHVANEPLHPIQYGLTGLALSVFYLLLLALAEHVGFMTAYGVAAVALCALLGVYIAGAFRSMLAGSGAAAAFALVYGLLYLLVTSEDYSLLTGAIGLFAILATVMVVTRKIDWYRAGARPEESGPESR
ncbi:MAG TPA: cell envelope integrity protein CreD [Steroidobacteraceae bacterium]|nr:cell envelope integrity protein CreD [Steroidobacteraceae bacterium]